MAIVHHGREWGVAASNGELFIFREVEDSRRIGNFQITPSDGTLCMCVGHSGDCFHDYIALRKLPRGKYQKAYEFSAYGFGKRAKVTISGRDFHLLQAGEPCEIKLPKALAKVKR